MGLRALSLNMEALPFKFLEQGRRKRPYLRETSHLMGRLLHFFRKTLHPGQTFPGNLGRSPLAAGDLPVPPPPAFSVRESRKRHACGEGLILARRPSPLFLPLTPLQGILAGEGPAPENRPSPGGAVHGLGSTGTLEIISSDDAPRSRPARWRCRCGCRFRW